MTPPAEANSTAARRFDPTVFRTPRPSPALIRALGPINRHVVLPGLLRLRRVELPAADLARLRGAVNRGTVAFVGPNHPEFFTDWMIDKEISRRVSPLMAHWASYEIVNIHPWVQGFWLRNNLIANAPGGEGKEYSVRWALTGHGVLLHPEGTASWNSDRIGTLLPGIAEMALEASRRVRGAGVRRPVFVAGIVWALRFVRDESRGLSREIEHIERALSLPASRGAPVEARFASLMTALVRRACEQFDLPREPAESASGAGYFAAQAATVRALLDRLAQRYGPAEGDLRRVAHRYRREIRARAGADREAARRDRSMVLEMERLAGFAPEIYDHPGLTQEQIAESLKRTRTVLVARTLADAIHNVVPVAVGPRVAHVRVPEPIEVVASQDGGADEAAGIASELRRRMQETLDRLRIEIAPATAAYRRPNPLFSRGRGSS